MITRSVGGVVVACFLTIAYLANQVGQWKLVGDITNLIVQVAQAAEPQTSVWHTRGFKEFRVGNFGNGGENLYVSRGGILQRIHQHNFNRDGWFDLVMCNSQDFWEQAASRSN